MNHQAGFTVVELVMIIVLLGIVSAVAVMKGTSPGLLTLASQAQKVANDIRHAQAVAHTRGQRMHIAVTTGKNGTYSVTCVTPCNGSSDFSGLVTKDVVLAGSDLYFNSWGQPVDNLGAALTADTTYTLCYPSCGSGNDAKTITVAQLTGAVTVSP